MGTKGREIVGMDISDIIELFNKALADEWLAYYQYWIGAKVVKGKMRGMVVAELEQHAGDELKHAGMLVGRIIQLDGTPILEPKDWYEKTNCGYDAPEDPSEIVILRQNIKGEQCAIDVYQNIVETVKDRDIITYDIVLEILKDEVEHEEDLQTILEDMKD